MGEDVQKKVNEYALLQFKIEADDTQMFQKVVFYELNLDGTVDSSFNTGRF